MSDADRTHDALEGLTVRGYRPADQPAVSRLYTDGLFFGQLLPNDTGADIENIAEAYLEDPANHFWVAERRGQVLGMIGVAAEDRLTAEVRRLRVDKQWQHGALAVRLLQTALDHCRHHGYLKVVLDTRFPPGQVMDLFSRFGFQHTRTKTLQGKELLEFYLDLYRPRHRDQGAGI